MVVGSAGWWVGETTGTVGGAVGGGTTRSGGGGGGGAWTAGVWNKRSMVH